MLRIGAVGAFESRLALREGAGLAEQNPAVTVLGETSLFVGCTWEEAGAALQKTSPAAQ